MLIGVVVCIGAVAMGPVASAVSPIVEREIQQLILQLASPVFRERDNATRRLKDLSWLCTAQLRNTIAVDPRPEAAERAADIIQFHIMQLTGLRTTLVGDGQVLFNARYSPDGQMVAALGSGKKVFVWDTRTGKQLHAISVPGTGYSVNFSPKHDWMIVGGEGGFAHCIEATTGKVQTEFDWKRGGMWYETVVSPDGARVLAIGTAHSAMFDATTGKELFALPEDARAGGGWGANFAPDGKLCATACRNSIIVWDAQDGKRIRTIDAPSVGGVAFSADGLRVVSGCSNGQVNVWDVTTGKKLWSAEAHTGWCCWPVFSPNDRFVSSSGHDGLVKLWDAKTGTLIHTYRGSANAILRTQFSPNNRQLLAAGWDGVVRIWNVAP